MWNLRHAWRGSGGPDEGSDALAVDDASDVAAFFEVEDDDGDAVFAAHDEGIGVHDLEVFFEGFLEGEFIVSTSVGVGGGVAGVHAVDLGGLEQNVAGEFGGAKGSASVGGEVGVSGSGGEDDDAALFHVSEGATSDEGLGDGSDFEGGHDAGMRALGFEGLAEGERIDDGAEHAHVVGGGPLDVPGFGEAGASDDVPAPNDDRDLGAVVGGVVDFAGNEAEFVGVDPEGAGLAKCLAGEFQENSPGLEGFVRCFGVLWVVHGSVRVGRCNGLKGMEV